MLDLRQTFHGEVAKAFDELQLGKIIKW